MSAFVLYDSIHTALAESVYNEILSRRSNYYYFIGRVLPWIDEQTPEQPLKTGDYEYNTRNGIISLKRINIGDVSLVVPRVDWSSGTVYDQYDSNYSDTFLSSTGANSIKTAKFYVLTPEFHVYKCLDNNNGAQSVVKPTDTDPIPTEYGDGYVWKYLYTIPFSLRNRFLTASYMPVQKQVTNKFYSNGQIDSVVITSPGTGYTSNSNVRLVVNGTFAGGNGNAIANLVPVINSTGQFVDVIIRNPGNNYLSANVTIIDGALTGTGYYNTSGKANIIPILYNKKIDRVLIDDPGIGYSSNTKTTITAFGDGINARFTPFINDAGQVEDIIIENRGEGYTYLDLEIVGDGANANATVNFSLGDLDTQQSIVELSAIPGAIEAFRIISPGNNYTTANITVIGDGQGFVGNVVINSNTNTIQSITVTDSGAGYTHANVVIQGNGTGANVRAIFAPEGGHGFNPIKELFADSIMFYSTINNERNQGIEVSNDYRQFGIIKDVQEFSNKKIFTDLFGTSCYLVTLSAVGNLIRDDVLTVSGATNKVFEIIEVKSSTNQILLLGKNDYALTAADDLFSVRLNQTFNITAINGVPTINKFTGDLLYIDNRTSVSYSDQQLVTLRTTIRL